MKPQVLLVGTYHFTSNLDMVSHVDKFNEGKDRHQLQELIELLAAFDPTALAVEITQDKQKFLDDEYQAYLSDKFVLESNEVHQVMYRLGKRLDIDGLNAVDWMDSVGNRGMGDVMEWAKIHQPNVYEEVYNLFMKNGQVENDNTIIENLSIINTIENTWDSHRTYMKFAQIGEETDYIGIDWLRWWYQRNLIIYKNIMELIQAKHDRVLLYIGAAHLHLIEQFLAESGEVDVVGFNEL